MVVRQPEWLDSRMRSLSLFFVLVLSVCSFAADLNQLTTKANAGDADAQYKLGVMYNTGNGALQDLDQAFQWFSKAARQGHAGSMHNLGIAYYNGSILGGHIPHNEELAWVWFTLAAEKGDASASKEAERVSSELGESLALHGRYRLGMMLMQGEGIPQDTVRALQVLEQAANEGSADARSELANAYEKGSGVPVDGPKAVYWLQQAAVKDRKVESRLRLAQIYIEGKLVPKDLDAAKEECSIIARSIVGMVCMAIVEEHRDPPRYGEAAIWYRNAAETGSAQAIVRYGTLLAEGKGVKQDYAKAYYWLSVADKAGFLQSKQLLQEVASKLSPKEIAKQDKEVSRLKIVPREKTSAAKE
jgi:uncharacterized protein